jgi:hypothetical protein
LALANAPDFRPCPFCAHAELVVVTIAGEPPAYVIACPERRTLGGDKAFDTTAFVAACRERGVTAHLAQTDTRRGGSAIDRRATRHAGYRVRQILRKRIEEHFGWAKTVGRIRQTVFRGLCRVDLQFKLTMTASNLLRPARIPIAVPAGARP